MPTIACPSCRGKLHFPEDSPARRVKCPTCGHVFLAPATTAPPAAPAPAEPRRNIDDRDDDRRRRDEDDDRDRRRGRDDDDDDRRRGRDDDDDRRSRRRDDERDRRGRRPADDDDRDRRRRRDEDDDYDRRPRSNPRAVEGQFNRASMACLLCFIGCWLQVGALGILVLVNLLQWAEIREGLNVFVIVAGVLGLGNLLTSATGYGFLVSGPRDRGALGLSIATAAVAAFHLIILLVSATTTFANTPDQRYAGVNWFAFVSELPALPRLLFWQIGLSGAQVMPGRGIQILPIFAGLSEAAKIVLFLLTLRAVARCARDSRRAKLCMQAMVANSIGVGVLLGAGILFGLLLTAVRTEKGGWLAVASVFGLVLNLTIAGLAVWTNLVTKSVKEGIDYRRD